MRAIQHSTASVEWYGPDYMGDLTRETFNGPINLDPASCYQANTLIGAESWYGPERGQDGLLLPWYGNVYNNPPGPAKYAALWYATLAHRFALGHVSQGMFMVFNLDTIRYALDYAVKQPLEFAVCVPRSRIRFCEPGQDGTPLGSTSPAHPSMIVYMGPNVDRFREAFTPPMGAWAGGSVFARRDMGEVQALAMVNMGRQIQDMGREIARLEEDLAYARTPRERRPGGYGPGLVIT